MPMFPGVEACPDCRWSCDRTGEVRRGSAVGGAPADDRADPLWSNRFRSTRHHWISRAPRHSTMPTAICFGRLPRRVENELGITVSIGLFVQQVPCQIAPTSRSREAFRLSEKAEPSPPGRSRSRCSSAWQGHAGTARRRREIRTIGGVQRMGEADLGKRYGSMGLRSTGCAADDTRKVSPHGEARASAPKLRFDGDIADSRRA